MDDDEEIQSHASPGSRSPESPIAGRITVTVASTTPIPAPENQLTLALPIQQVRHGNNSSGGGGGGREDCWSEAATAVLIEAWGERYLELSRGNLKQKHWKEVSEVVSRHEEYGKIPKTDIQCKNRIDTVKKKYKLEKSKIASGSGPSKWPFYERLDFLVGPTAKMSSLAAVTAAAAAANSPSPRLPVGIPVHHRASPFPKRRGTPSSAPPPPPIPPPRLVDSGSSGSGNASTDSEADLRRKRQKVETNIGGGGGDSGGWGGAVRELTRAIVKFGKAYEQAESEKIEHIVEMEKQRMKFAKDLELQRMQFFMKTQLEISQLKHGGGGGGRRGGGAGNHHRNHSHHQHHSNNNTNNVNNHHHSDSSN